MPSRGMMSAATITYGSQEELLALYLDGDAAAFEEIVRLYSGPLSAYLVRCGIDEMTRQDLLQEILLNIARGASHFEPKGSLKIWIYTVAANTVRSHFRALAAHKRLPKEGVAGHSHSHMSDALDRIEARETARWIEEASAQLPLLQREVLALSSLKGMAAAEIAEVLGVPIGTVKTSLRRARLTLAQALTRREVRAKREVSL